MIHPSSNVKEVTSIIPATYINLHNHFGKGLRGVSLGGKYSNAKKTGHIERCLLNTIKSLHRTREKAAVKKVVVAGTLIWSAAHSKDLLVCFREINLS